jgi:hypothetical protein
MLLWEGDEATLLQATYLDFVSSPRQIRTPSTYVSKLTLKLDNSMVLLGT